MLLSQPLAAFDLNCSIGMGHGGSKASSEHCAGHSGAAHDAAGDQQQTTDEQPVGPAASGGHCQSCVFGVVLLPVATHFDSISAPSASALLVTLLVPQFQSGPLYRPPIH
jgi:hypothetical protein